MNTQREDHLQAAPPGAGRGEPAGVHSATCSTTVDRGRPSEAHMGEHKHLDRRELAAWPPSPSGVCSSGPDEFQYTDEELAGNEHRRADRRTAQRHGPGRLCRQGGGAGRAAHAGAGAGDDAPGGGRILDGPHRRHGGAEARASSLRAYAQTDPVVAYKKEGYEMFEAMVARHPGGDHPPHRSWPGSQERTRSSGSGWPRSPASPAAATAAAEEGSPSRKTIKIGRNDPCPCGSGKKYKKCCYLKDKAAQ